MPKIGSFVQSVYREESPSQTKITEALCEASLEFAPIVLDEVGYRDGETYRYASLWSIRRSTQPALFRHGLFLNHVYTQTDQGECLVSVLRHKEGEYQSSTQIVPMREDMQEQDAIKTMLIKSAEKALLSIIVAEEPKAAAAGGVSAETKAQWEQNLMLALKAIGEAETEVRLERCIATAEQRVKDGLMSPDAIEVVRQKCADRVTQLKKEKASANGARTAGDQGEDAAGSGGGASDRDGGKAAGTGRGAVRAGDRRSASPA